MEHSASLTDALIVLLAAIVAVPLMRRLRMSPVVAYLLAGVVIGPDLLGLIHEAEATTLLAELGVIFLLFVIGLDLPVERLKAMRSLIFGLGLAQVAATSAVIGGVALWIGFPPEAALILGGALALSSTATALQTLSERGELGERAARVTTAVLLFQDLAVVPLLAVLPLLGGDEGSLLEALGLAGVKAAIALTAIFLAGRYLLRPLMRVVAGARAPEVFAAATLFVVLATGWITAWAGMSMALGAFLAGLMLAGTAWRHQVEADIQPFRGLLLGLFFITIGMGLDLPLLVSSARDIALITVGLLILKAAILVPVARLFGEPWPRAARVGLVLAQGSEFAFVLLGAAAAQGVVPAETAQPLFVSVALGMAATPLLAELGARVERRWTPRGVDTVARLSEQCAELEDHVIVAGYGRVGRTISRLLAEHGAPHIALDADAAQVARARAADLSVFYGDASRLEVWRAAGIARARAVVITLDSAGAAHRAVSLIRAENPRVPIVVRSRDRQHRRDLVEAGATQIVLEAVEASLQLGARALAAAGVPAADVERTLVEFRADDYAKLDDSSSLAAKTPPSRRRRA